MTNFLVKEQLKNYYDLEERTENFAKKVRSFTKRLPRTVENIDDIKQLNRATGSVASNYIEANESLSKKDFLYRLKVCRKEAKESRLFLRLIDTGDDVSLEEERGVLIQEATELMKIFGSIITKTEIK